MTVVRDTPSRVRYLGHATLSLAPRMGTVEEATLPLSQVRRDSSEDVGQMGVRDHDPVVAAASLFV